MAILCSVLNFKFSIFSETTDEQCIPESISEAHDSAVDDVDDSDIAEDQDTDNDKSPNCDISVNVPPLPINLGNLMKNCFKSWSEKLWFYDWKVQNLV